MSIKERVREFICENFYVDSPADLSDDASLLQRGIVDSTGVLELVAFLEATFGIQVDDMEIVPENLDSLQGISMFVGRKQAYAGDLRLRAHIQA